LIILNPSTLTFLLDRLFSNLFKMIKVGTTIRMRNVIIASLIPPSERRRRKVDVWPAPNFRILFGAWQATARLHRIEADLGFRLG
jgi:hypothetical protein